MHFHWQNLAQEDQPTPRLPLEGRCWLWFDEDGNKQIQFSWSVLPDLGPGVDFTINGHGEGGVQLGLHSRLFSTWLAYERLPEKILKLLNLNYEGRRISLDWYSDGGFLHWSLWTDPHGGFDRTWRDGSFNVADFLLGKAVHSEKVIDEVQVTVPMPEGEYPAKVTLTEATWKRPRWFPLRVRRAEVDLKDNPIGIPGKGENSWDCGDDAMYSVTVGASNVSEAVGKVVEWALRDRLNYGGMQAWKWDKPPMPPRGAEAA